MLKVHMSKESFKKDDDFETPKIAWEYIKDYIPKDKVIWEPFYCNGLSGNILTELGFNVIHENEDFWKNDKGDIIVTNPPFSNKPKILERLKELGKPFILLLPNSVINKLYFRKLFKDEPMQILIPPKRINFINSNYKGKNQCYFDCFYYCWKMNLPKDIIYLE